MWKDFKAFVKDELKAEWVFYKANPEGPLALTAVFGSLVWIIYLCAHHP